LLLLPMFHSFTEMVCMVTPVFNGGSIVLIEKISAAELRRHVLRYRPTILAAIPDVFASLAAAKPSLLARWLNPFRVYISGGAPLPGEIHRRFVRTWRRPLLEGYGLSEASPVVAVNPLHGVCKVGTVGLPIPDVEVRIVDDQLHTLPTGVPGEIAVRGPSVMLGYYNNPIATGETIRDGWLLTGDIGSMDADGYVTIHDRKKEMLIYRGCNVYPREVEEVLYSHPAVAEAAVVGWSDPVKGDVPIAFVVLREGQRATERELKRYCVERLARYKVPRQVFMERELPKTPTGKILKRELRKRSAELAAPPAAADEP
jgi:long-chain acyl-CoA synthetase